jgi:GGDEF domain-containing protein
VLSVKRRGLEQFWETRGLVAGDDMLRTVALRLTHVIEARTADAFMGHHDTTDFPIISGPDQMESLERALRARANKALSLFYPYANREIAGSDLRLSISVGVLKPSRQLFEVMGDMKASLVDVQEGPATSGE